MANAATAGDTPKEIYCGNELISYHISRREQETWNIQIFLSNENSVEAKQEPERE